MSRHKFNNKANKNQKVNKGEDRQAASAKSLNPSTSGSNKKPNLSALFKRFNHLYPLLLFIVFGIFSYVYLVSFNSDYLYACQEFSIWQDTGYYFSECMRVIGGFSEWLGTYFTQYFYYPKLGALLLIGLWGLIYFLTIRVFKLRNRWTTLALAPCVLLLCSEINLGYWLYYIKMPGYWFTYTICILLMLVFMYLVNLTKGYLKSVLILVYVFCLYPLIGIWSMIGGLLLSVQTLLSSEKCKYVSCGAGVLGIILSPLFYYQIYTTSRSQDIWTKMFPVFQNDKYIESNKMLPFFGICIVMLALLFLSKYLQGTVESTEKPKSKGIMKYTYPVINIALIVVYFLVVSSSNVSDANFHSELRMYKSLGECDWEGVLNESASNPNAHTRQMIMCQNIALLHDGSVGNIGDKMFHYNNKTQRPHVNTYSKSSSRLAEDKERYSSEEQSQLNGNIELDSLHVNLCNTAGPLIYFMYGKCNFAYRWCVENGVEFTFRVDEYKNMIRCAMMTEEYDLAIKYINILKHTTFHEEWADERLAMIRDKKKYESSKEYQCVHPLYASFKNALDGDQGLVEMYLINYFSHMNSNDPKFQEATLAFALIQKDISLFWPRFFKYAELHEKEPMPIHYQEAAYLFGNLEHTVDISKMPFDKEKIVNRYANFKSMTMKLMQMYGPQYSGNEMGLTRKVGDECFNDFGDTYWWFYYFSRDVHTY